MLVVRTLVNINKRIVQKKVTGFLTPTLHAVMSVTIPLIMHLHTHTIPRLLHRGATTFEIITPTIIMNGEICNFIIEQNILVSNCLCIWNISQQLCVWRDCPKERFYQENFQHHADYFVYIVTFHWGSHNVCP